MSRIENFSAELVSPELFREICALISTVSKSCALYTAKPEESPDEDEELLMCAINSQNTFQMWVHLSSGTMFNEFRLVHPEWIEVKSDSLAHAFRNEAGLMSMTEVRMRISRKQVPSRDSREVNGTASQSVSSSTRLVSFTMDNKSVDAVATKAIEQRIYAEQVERDEALAEPSLAGIKYWADPSSQQLHQMAKVCDQYKQMSDTVRITVSKSGLITLVSETQEAIANTSWRVDLAERADEPEDEDPLFVDEADQHARAPASRNPDEETCAVLARDWYTVLQARRMCRRLVVGVLDNQGLVAYGFLKQGKSMSMQDVATFYLWHQE